MINKEKTVDDVNSAYTKLENVTPQMAGDFLSKNYNNRNINSKTVSYYKDMILRGKWLVNGESIKISQNGELLDGQHRLEAIRQANVPVKMFVAYNVAPNAFMTIDAGRPRRYTDYLKVSGNKCADLNALSAAARIAMGFDKNGEYTVAKKISPELLLWYVDKHPCIEDAVGSVGGRLNNICSRSIASGVKYIFSVVDEVATECFFDSLITGVNLPEGSPVLALRTRMMNMRGGGGATWQKEVVHCFVTAFNAYTKNKKVTYIKFLDGQKTILDGFKGQLSDSCFLASQE